MGIAEMVWGRVRNIGRVLGSLWIFKFHMDSSCRDKLESDQRVELCLCRHRIRMERSVPGEKLVASCECHGSES